MKVHIVCRNYEEDRVVPRMARALRDGLGWSVDGVIDARADVNYLLGYFEAPKNMGARMDSGQQPCRNDEPQMDSGQQPCRNDEPQMDSGLRRNDGPRMAAYMTHREEEPPGNGKARLFDLVASKAQLRIVTAPMYYDLVSQYGNTMRMHAPIERERFTIKTLTPPSPKGRGITKPVIGFSGYAYANQRKGEDMVQSLVGAMHASPVLQGCEFRASGRGWPVPTRKYSWAEMPGFYQGLDILVCTSRVEGIPMPPLEALSCGVPIVIPWHVGMLDELPEMPGIYRYERGDVKSLLKALEQWADTQVRPYKAGFREALRAATEPHSVQAWVEEHKTAFEQVFNSRTSPCGENMPAIQAEKPVIVAGKGAGEGESRAEDAEGAEKRVTMPRAEPQRALRMQRGIYVVAFGGPARETAKRLIESIAKFMPDVPVCLVGSEPIELTGGHAGPPLQFVKYPDTDIGARRAKLAIYELAPQEWQQILYLDADTVLTAPVYALFDWIERGWEFVICRDLYPRDTLSSFQQRYDKAEVAEMIELLQTWEVQQLNGGVWSFCRSERTKVFFESWKEEYEKYCQRDQGALLRALYKHPLKMLVLGNEWNTFPKFQNGQVTAGILHYPQEARRWAGQIRGRIDGQEAWQAVKRFEAQDSRNGRGNRQ